MVSDQWSERRNMSVQKYQDMIVWQKPMQLVKTVYVLVKKLPKEEMYALGDQIRRAAVSIPSNIAEGQERNSTRCCRHKWFGVIFRRFLCRFRHFFRRIAPLCNKKITTTHAKTVKKQPNPSCVDSISFLCKFHCIFNRFVHINIFVRSQSA